MSRKTLLNRVQTEQIVGVVREDSLESAESVADAYAMNGIGIIEVTLTTPDAIQLIAVLANRYPQLSIAAGTVRSTNDAALARRAGAQIIVSPHTDPRVIEYANENDLLCIAGAATPTEIIRAWEAGCDVVKVYPANHLGGPDYIRTIRGPIRDVPMLAGGLVPLDIIDTYLDAGCIAVNLGASLALPDLVRSENWEEIGRRVGLATAVVQGRRALVQADGPYVH
ncbi:MAG: bifunctional 4-hydroxy-2-oxoglutarate aldolase/2-dehydro-3-deoxy-phosphogluconate aldolase [Acidobacteria bacterium]|nr:bifunctional 4-hydroxy-2-oxoglutarate aldolase/2-dehydro-3-deoxy-phosphogluconate aldolase [Acidobacteriota bacterium]MBV9477242.1 bifunctional 4-hydroxy-2-oxoglutarate aldolase/2-dehydro-3-deoxy-phosphogluconate aldolase [Acidobacteriota bacterium]